jgi:hypothetical protein
LDPKTFTTIPDPAFATFLDIKISPAIPDTIYIYFLCFVVSLNADVYVVVVSVFVVVVTLFVVVSLSLSVEHCFGRCHGGVVRYLSEFLRCGNWSRRWCYWRVYHK